MTYRRPLALLLSLAACAGTAVAVSPATAAAATFRVDSIADTPDRDRGDGVCATSENVCTLRAAIHEANALTGADRIEFVTPTGAKIVPLLALPAITEAVEINAQTLDGQPSVELDGSLLPAGTTQPPAGTFDVLPPHGLEVTASQVKIRGLAIHSFPGAQIGVRGASNLEVAGNRLGLDASGELDRGRSLPGGIDSAGIMFDRVTSASIGGSGAFDGNVVAGLERGILVIGGSFVTVAGNRVGLSASGTSPIGNDFDGIFVALHPNGTRPSNVTVEANAVAATGQTADATSDTAAIGIRDDGAGTRIVDNWIGYSGDRQRVRSAGGRSFGTRDQAIQLHRSTDAVVRGNHVAAAATSSGIRLATLTSRARLTGNVIGLDRTGTRAVDAGGAPTGNALSGITVDSSTDTTIGGPLAADANTIAANDSGVLVTGSAHGTRIEGNRIGTGVTGAEALPHRLHGIAVQASGNLHPNPVAIVGNRLAGEPGASVSLRAGGGHTVFGNVLGIGTDGEVLDGGTGVLVLGAREVQVGSDEAGTGNTIAGMESGGVEAYGVDTKGLRIAGNRIGLGEAGSADPQDSRFGVGVGVYVDGSEPGYGAPSDVRIGGFDAQSGNRVANAETGVQVLGPVKEARLFRNVIGLGDGGAPAPNTVGVTIRGASGVEVGSILAGNTIAANEGDGLQLLDGADDAIVQGNRIGLRENGVDLPNGGNGVYVEGARRVTIGEPLESDSLGECLADGLCNRFGPNGWQAVSVVGETAQAWVRGNRFDDPSQLPIDLEGDGTTALDERDWDEGPNGLLNTPAVVQEVENVRDGTVWVTGAIEHDDPRSVTVDVYSQSLEGAPGAGNRWIGTVRANKRGQFLLKVPAGRRGVRYSALAHSDEGTSEWAHGCGTNDADLAGDSDDDGLCDEWEVYGIDYDLDFGVDEEERADLRLPARVGRRDIWVELDAIERHPGKIDPQPGKLALDLVSRAFAEAPGGDVKLHWMGSEPGRVFDDSELRGELVIDGGDSVDGEDNDINDYRYGSDDLACDGSFGTSAERADVKRCFARIGARGVAVRYVLSANELAKVTPPRGGPEIQPLGLAPNFRLAALGLGLMPGSYYKATGGSRRECRSERSCTDVEFAYTLLHELGHTMGLEHGGESWEHENNPAHLSVMSYVYSATWNDNPLDFARTDGLELHESSVDERTPFTLDPVDLRRGWHPLLTEFLPSDEGPGDCIVSRIAPGEPVDFDGDGDTDDHGFVHGLDDEEGTTCRNPAEPRSMEGYEEWSRLVLATGIGRDDLPLSAADAADHDGHGGDFPDVEAALASDLDRDGVPLQRDVCPAHHDPAQTDGDGDGTGDACVGHYVPSDLMLELDAPREVAAGREAELQVRVTEDWPFPTPGATVRVELPAGFELVSAGGDGAYDAATGRWRTGDLAGRATRALKLTVRAAAPTAPARFAAEIVEAVEEDVDSTPGDGDAEQDDQAETTVAAVTGDPDPREPEPREPEPREPEPREPEPRDPEPRNPEPRNPEPRSPEPREPGPRTPIRADRRVAPDGSCAAPCRPSARGEVVVHWLCTGAPVGGGGRCGGTLAVTARGARRGARPLGSARLSGAAGRAVRTRVKLSPAARRTLARRGRLAAVVVLKVRRADGRTVTIRRPIAIRAAPRRAARSRGAGRR